MGGIFWKTAKKRLHRALFPPIWGGLEVVRCIAPLSAPDTSHFSTPKKRFIFDRKSTPPPRTPPNTKIHLNNLAYPSWCTTPYVVVVYGKSNPLYTITLELHNLLLSNILIHLNSSTKTLVCRRWRRNTLHVFSARRNYV